MGNLPGKRGYTAIEANLSSTQMTHSELDKCVFVALYDFPLIGQTDITVQIGEQLNVLSEDGDWWKVVSLSTRQECYMPRNYIAKVYNRWLYKGINREKAEELLSLGCNHGGSFLIRESETRRDSFTLSVRRANQASRDSIKHYRINRLDNGWFYISPRLTFPSLQEMVDYYSEVADGICCILKEPCMARMVMIAPVVRRTSEPIIVRNPTLNWKNLDGSALFNGENNLNEDCPVSLGLREAVSSYMLLTEDSNSAATLRKEHWWKTC
ncbi:src-like-adapter 2 [Rhinophrynus dorsalis]